MRLIMCFIVCSLFCTSLWASVNTDSQQKYLSVDGYQFYSKSLNSLYKAIQLKRASVTQKQLLESVIQNHLLAKTAHKELPGNEMQRAQQQAKSEYRQLLKVLAPVLAENPDAWIIQPFALEQKTLASIFNKSKGLKKNVYRLSPRHQQTAEKAILMTYQLNALQKSISLWQLYNRESVQGKAEFYNGNLQYVKKLALDAMHEDQLQFNRELAIGLTKNESRQMQDIILNKQLQRAYMHHRGLAADVHHDNEALNKALSRVSDKAVQASYNQRKNEFLQVASAKARHIVLSSQQQADKVMAELKAGLVFEEAVIKFSLSEDKNQAVPGDLGLIKRGAENLSFAQKIALLSKVGKPSQSYREPGGKSWQIIQVDRRSAEPLPITDSGVYQTIKRQLALQLLEQDMQTFRRDLLTRADIQTSPQLTALNLFMEAKK